MKWTVVIIVYPIMILSFVNICCNHFLAFFVKSSSFLSKAASFEKLFSASFSENYIEGTIYYSIQQQIYQSKYFSLLTESQVETIIFSYCILFIF
ncbi:MAG: hypothetical protein KME31_31425 [Tolypothrix carrinoi HA7290-LM1]|nr:hypothetical protein [Tolypothrix carrinoi HA7290-LM1]